MSRRRCREPLAQQRERMPAQRERQRPVVGDDVLAFGRRGELGRGFVERAAREERRQPLDAGDVPHRAVTMAGERARARPASARRVEVAPVERGAVREIGDVVERRARARAATSRCAPASVSPAIIRRPRRSAGSGTDHVFRATFVALRTDARFEKRGLTPIFLERAVPVAHRRRRRGSTTTPCRRASCDELRRARRSPSAAS